MVNARRQICAKANRIADCPRIIIIAVCIRADAIIVCVRANARVVCIKTNVIAVWETAKEELQSGICKEKIVLRTANRKKIKYKLKL